MKKHVGVLFGVSLLALYAIQEQARTEAASAVLLGSVLLTAAAAIRHRAPKL
ncbi:MAG TPA: hypothetical protein VKV17_05855 [Bryobacteraceae bacterium]|nr:hypothetical protein [Bryobacteraceae bacterium]